MSTTPEINNVASKKFSPFGGAINKSLLTPCRRVGLSRNRKTPNSTLKLSSEILNNSNNSVSSSVSLATTPVSVNRTLNKRNKMNFESPLKKDGSLSKDNTDGIIRNRNSSNSVKTNVDEDESLDILKKTSPLREIMTNSHSQRTIENKEKLLKSQGETENTSDCMATPRKTNSTIVKTPSYIESTPIFSFEESETSTPINPTSLKPKKSNVPHDSDEEFLPSNRKRPKLKLTKSERPLANKTRLEQTTKTSSGNMVDSLENCKIRNVKIKPENESSDEEVFARVKKRKIKVITDDEDSCRGSQNSLNTLSDDFINGSVKTTEIPEACLGSKKNICKKSSFVDNLEDEEDAFTSTPDKEKNEKRYLIEKIYILENQIREKRKKLENLKQASVYKAIHNIEDLGKLTEKYREACVEGLRGLLSQLQAHTSISMPTLLHNLHIPGEMVTKLALSEEI